MAHNGKTARMASKEAGTDDGGTHLPGQAGVRAHLPVPGVGSLPGHAVVRGAPFGRQEQ